MGGSSSLLANSQSSFGSGKWMVGRTPGNRLGVRAGLRDEEEEEEEGMAVD